MRRFVATMTLFGCIWVVPCNAQQPDPKNEKDRAAARAAMLRAAERRATEEPCPFTSPRLSSTDPAEVAWAAARLTAEDCQKPEVPERLVLPKLEVVWEDSRRDEVKKAQPMPERR